MILAILVLAVLGGLWYAYSQFSESKTRLNFEAEEVEYLTLSTVINELKRLNLNKDVHSPFLAKNTNGFFKDIKNREGYEIIITGVFNDKEESFLKIKAYYTKNISNDILNVLGKDDFVKLS